MKAVSVLLLSLAVPWAMADGAAKKVITVTEMDAGKTVLVDLGQRVEVRLRGTEARSGWEGGTSAAGALKALPPRMVPDPLAKDAAIGTYLFPYQAVAAGRATLRFRYVVPGGPGVTARDATRLVRSFEVTVEVRAAGGKETK